MNKALFLNLVMMLGSTAMQQLGKIVSPLSGKAEVDLRGAQASIDMLSMLQAKSEGNLDSDETRMLGDTLSSLQMNYVETARSAEAQPSADPAEAPTEATGEDAGEEAPEAEATDAPEASATEGESKDPKFHKSYGD